MLNLRHIFCFLLVFVSVGAFAAEKPSSKADSTGECETYLSGGFAPFHANLYRRLNVNPTATAAEIKSAYREAAKKFHPDANRDSIEKIDFNAAFRNVTEAYDVLSDINKRRNYDEGKFNAAEPTGSEAEIVLRSPGIYYKSLLKVLDSIDAKTSATVLNEVAKLATKGPEFWEDVEASIHDAEYKPWANHDDFVWASKFGGERARETSRKAQGKVFKILEDSKNLTPEIIRTLSTVDVTHRRLYDLWIHLHGQWPQLLSPLTQHIADDKSATDQAYVIGEIRKVYGQPATSSNGRGRAVGLPEPLLLGLRAGVMGSDNVLGLLATQWPDGLKALFPNVPFAPSELLALHDLRALSVEETQVTVRAFALIERKSDSLNAKMSDLVHFSNLNPEYVVRLRPRTLADSWNELSIFVKALTAGNINSKDLNLFLGEMINHDYASELAQQNEHADQARENFKFS